MGIFKIALHLTDRHVFIWQSLENVNVFNTLILKPIFSDKKTFFKKLKYCFLVESTKIENATFPYKTALSKANVETNRMGSRRSTYHKKWNFFPVTTLVFRKFCFCLRTSCKELIWCTNHPNVHIHSFRKCWSFIWGSFFPVSILKYIHKKAPSSMLAWVLNTPLLFEDSSNVLLL